MYKLISLLLIVVFTIFIQGCQNEGEVMAPIGSFEDSNNSTSNLAKRPRTMVWADGELFASVVTLATFKPESDPFDQLYAGPEIFMGGVSLISESKPGDQDYNGGRWHKNVLKADVTTDYSAATSVEDLDLNDFESTEDYFECPLLPRRGH
jgi:hypothetical protein